MKNLNNKKIGILNSIILTTCLIAFYTPTNTNCGFFEASKSFVSNTLTKNNLKKVVDNASSTLINTKSTLGRFFPTNYGIKAIASSLFIAKNVSKFYNLRNDVKSGVLKHIPFYLENTGSLLQSFSNFNPFGVAFSGIKLLLGKAGVKAASNFISYTFVKPIKLNLLYQGNLEALETAEKEEKENKAKLRQSYVDELRESKARNNSFLYDFIRNSYDFGGIKSIAESLSIASNGFSFYNKENNIKAGAKSTIPFYLKNTSSLLTSIIDGEKISPLITLSKMAIGKTRTKYITSKLKSITPNFIQPMLFDKDKTTTWFWNNKSSWFHRENK